jgi:hypothetical protein
LRAQLERDGVVTGALPHCTYDLGGKWSDEFGGKLTGYQRYVSQAYPEVRVAAGMDIKAKLAALAKREEEFRRERRSNRMNRFQVSKNYRAHARLRSRELGIKIEGLRRNESTNTM